MKCMGRKAQGRPLESRDLGKRLRAGKQPLDKINTLVPSVRYRRGFANVPISGANDQTIRRRLSSLM